MEGLAALHALDVPSHPMKNPSAQTWIPALASLISAGSVVLFFFMPLDTIRIQQLPEARNGSLYCFRKREEMIFLSINRGGGLSVEGRAIAERELPELLSVIRKKSGEGPISLRVSLDPGAPARAVRIAYESGVEAGVSTMSFAVRWSVPLKVWTGNKEDDLLSSRRSARREWALPKLVGAGRGRFRCAGSRVKPQPAFPSR